VRFCSLALGTFRSWLLEHGAYELLTVVSSVVVWYVISLAYLYRVLVLTCVGRSRALCSIEGVFRNSRWLEREVAEMVDIWYRGKRDRRALFLVPLLY